MSHLILPKKSDWMTMEERADNLMDSRLRSLVSLLDDHVLESEFFHALDRFYEDARLLAIRGRREEFDRVVLLVIEALIREKFKAQAYSKYLSWRFELHTKNNIDLNLSNLPKSLTDFIMLKKNQRIEGVLDLFFKRQSKEWYNPYLSFVGVRNEEVFEIKILFKNISYDLIHKNEIRLSQNHQDWEDVLNQLLLVNKAYISFSHNGLGYKMASLKRVGLGGEFVEIGLWHE